MSERVSVSSNLLTAESVIGSRESRIKLFSLHSMLRTDVSTREVSLKHVSDEGRFSSRVLSDEEHHWSGIEIRVRHGRGMEFLEFEGLLEGQDLIAICFLQLVDEWHEFARVAG